MEVDIYPREHPELAELINGYPRKFSAFHTTFDYYADGSKFNDRGPSSRLGRSPRAIFQ